MGGDWYTDTPNNISTKAVLLGIYSTFVMAGPSYMMMVSKHHASSVGFPDSGGVGGVGGG